MSTGVPDGWAVPTIDDICEPVSKRGPDAEQHTFRYIDLGAIDNKSKEIAEASELQVKEAPSRAKQIVRKGDVVFSNVRVYLENIALVPDKLDGEVASTAFCVLRPKAGIEPRYLYHYVTSKPFIRTVNELQRGNSPPSVQDGDVKSQSIPLAPEPEQKRIVSKIDELFSRIDEGERALERVSKLVERYRQSVLKAAVTGELTRDWREARKAACQPIESGEALLTLILTARREAWEQAERAKMQVKGITPKDDAWKKKYKEAVPTDCSDLVELPDGWTWASIDQVAADTLIGLDRGSADQRAEKSGCPYIKMNNVTMRGEVLFDDAVYITASAEDRNKFALKSGDILFNTRNSKELVGKTGLVVSPPSASTYNNNLMRIRSVRVVDARYLVAQMCEPRFRERMELVKKATTSVAAVYAKDLLPLAVAVPPIEEQAVICSEVDRQMSLADQLEREITLRKSGSRALRQSLLRAAFRGELVEQDLSDEPASALLTPIAAERAESTTTAKKRAREKKSV